jgi:hypothetical protein
VRDGAAGQCGHTPALSPRLVRVLTAVGVTVAFAAVLCLVVVATVQASGDMGGVGLVELRHYDPSASDTPSAAPSDTATPAPSDTATPGPTATATESASPGPSESVTPSPTASECPSAEACLRVSLSAEAQGALDGIQAVLIYGFGLVTMLLAALVVRSVWGS